MQINPLLKDLVEQYYGSMEALPSDMVQFLQTVNNLFTSVEIESGKLPLRPKPVEETAADSIGEEQVWLIQEFSSRLVEKSSKQEIFDLVIDFLGEHHNFTSIKIYSHDSANNELRLAASSSASQENGSSSMVIGAVRAAADSRKTLFTSYDPQANVLEQQPLEIAIPLLTKGELVGVLNILAESKKDLSSKTRVFLEMVASQASFAISAMSRPGAQAPTPALAPASERITLPEVNAPVPQADPASYKDISSLRYHQYSYDTNLRAAVPLADSVDIDIERLPNRPLEVQGQIIGAFGIQASEEEPLTAEERALLESISEEVSQALERAQLFESSQRSAAELAVLNEMGNLFSEAPDETTIVEGLYTYTSKLIETPQFYVAYYDEDTDSISFPKVILNGELVTPDHPSASNFVTRPAGTGLTGYIIKNRRPILIERNAEEVLESLDLPFQRFGGQTQSWLGVPMTMGEQVLGVITIQCDTTPGLYNQHHLELLSTIASQAAVAINNIRLFNQEQERAEQERLVRTITDKVRRGTTSQAIMQIAIEELSKVLNAEVSSIQLGTPDQLIETTQPAEEPQTPPQPGQDQDDLSGIYGNYFEEES